MCYVSYNRVADTCYVQSHIKWIHYNDAKVSEVLSKQFTSSNEIKVEILFYIENGMHNPCNNVGKCLSCCIYMYITNEDCKHNVHVYVTARFKTFDPL